MPEGESTPAGGPWWRPGELWRAVCLGDLLGPWLSVSGGVSLVARGPRDGPDVVPLHGCMDAQGRAPVL